MPRMIFAAPTQEEALERAASELNLPSSALEHEVLEDARDEDYIEGEEGVCIRVRVRQEFLAEKAGEILQGLLTVMGIDCSLVTEIRQGTIEIQVLSENGSLLIGRGGGTLDSIQHWLGRALARVGHSTPPIVIDIESYRRRKFDRLESMARHLAQQALREGEPVKLKPMGPIERKYIHNALKDCPGVSTFSVGREGERYVVISPAEGARPTEELADQPAERRPEKSKPGREPRGKQRRPPAKKAAKSRKPTGEGAGPIVIDHSDLPEDELIADESAYSQLGIFGVDPGDEEPSEEDENWGNRAPDDEDEGFDDDEPDDDLDDLDNRGNR